MKFMNQAWFYGRQFRNEEGGGQKGASGGGEGSDNTDPAVLEQIQKLQDSIKKLEDNNKALLQEKADAKEAARKAADEAARKSGDVEALERSWQEKLNTAVTAKDSELAGYRSMVESMTSGQAAYKMAAELAIPGSADVLLPHIQARLQTEIKDGKAVVRVLDKDGKPSAMTIDELKKEIEDNKAFAPLIVGSKASGDGKPGSKGSPQSKTVKRSEWDAMDSVSRMAFAKDGGKVID